jgi:hypothetical protein
VSPNLIDGPVRIRLLQDRDDLGLGEFRLTHGNLLAQGGYCARKFSV